DLGAAGRAGADRGRRPALARPAARQRLRPPRRPLLAARAGRRDGGGRRVPDAPLRRVRRLHAADSRSHRRLRFVPRRGRGAAPGLYRRPSLRRGKGVVARRDAVDLYGHRGADHDDHVAGINLLRDATGAEAWIPENVAPVLAEPRRHDLPCLWYEPVRADRVLPLGMPVRWREHELTLHPLPGHTRYQAAVSFEVD